MIEVNYLNNNLEKMMVRHEGLKLKPYHCPNGKLTIGVGRNLEDRGISKDEALALMRNDILLAFGELSAHVPIFCELGNVRQAVLIDMCFNLGLPRFLKFERMLEALDAMDFETVAKEMLNSKWASQVKNRAVELAELMVTGEWADES